MDHIVLVSVKYLYWLSCSNLFLTSQKDLSCVAIHLSSDGIRTVEDVYGPLVFNLGPLDAISKKNRPVDLKKHRQWRLNSVSYCYDTIFVM